MEGHALQSPAMRQLLPSVAPTGEYLQGKPNAFKFRGNVEKRDCVQCEGLREWLEQSKHERKRTRARAPYQLFQPHREK